MNSRSFILSAVLSLCLVLIWSPAQARVCGAAEQKVLDEVERDLGPVADGEAGTVTLTSTQTLAELRLSGLSSCDGMVGLRAGVLALKLRFVRGEVHTILPEMELYLRNLEAEDSGGPILGDFNRFAVRVAGSDRIASSIDLVAPGLQRRGEKLLALESDSPIALEARVRDRAGRLVQDIHQLSFTTNHGVVVPMGEEAGLFRALLTLDEVDRSIDLVVGVGVPLRGAALREDLLKQQIVISVRSNADVAAEKREREAARARDQRDREAARAREVEQTEQRRRADARRAEARSEERRQAFQRKKAAVVVPGVVVGLSFLSATVGAGVASVTEWNAALASGQEFGQDKGLSENDVDDIFMRGDAHASNAAIAATVSSICGVSALITAIAHGKVMSRFRSKHSQRSGTVRLEGVALAPQFPAGAEPGLSFSLRGSW